MDGEIRRSARPEGRHRRLDRAAADLRDALLRPARDGKHAGLSDARRGKPRPHHRGRSRPRAAELEPTEPTLGFPFPYDVVISYSARMAAIEDLWFTAKDGLKLHALAA